jgi:hypothetical protein
MTSTCVPARADYHPQTPHLGCFKIPQCILDRPANRYPDQNVDT